MSRDHRVCYYYTFSLNVNCLLEESDTSNQLSPSPNLELLPGETFTLDEQCQQIVQHPGSFYCRVGMLYQVTMEMHMLPLYNYM